MIRKELYLKVCDALRSVAEIQHVDLWNRNVEFIEQETAWARPAVFVEICPITWNVQVERIARRGVGKLKLHIVTDWVNAEECLESWELPEKIEKALREMEASSNFVLDLAETYTNHDHEEIVESVDVYNVRYHRTMQ